MNNLMIFENKNVEVFEFKGQVLFNPYDVGKCLELEQSSVRNHLANMNTKQAMTIKNSDVLKMDIRKLNNRGEKFLTESGVYKLIFKSNKPNAEKFSDWVTDEVLPSIRKTGEYKILKKREEDIGMINEAANIILPIAQQANMDIEKQTYLLRQLYSRVNLEIPMQIYEQKDKLFDKTTIAKELGVLSNKGKPHLQAIGAIISKLNISEDEKVLTSYEKNGHIDTDYQYKESVVNKIQNWISKNNYPTIITKDDKSYKVTYKSIVIE